MGFSSQSQEIGKISAALLKAQKEIVGAKKEAENPYFKSKYADLGAVLAVCKGPLNNQGISVLQPMISDESGVYVMTTLLHESGEYLSSKVKITPIKNDPQAHGSAITYARRYGLQAMLSIPSEDDDANDAMGDAVIGAKPKEDKEDKPLGDGLITEKQRKRFFAIFKKSGKKAEEVTDYLEDNYGINKSDMIKKEWYEDICNWLEGK